MNTNRSKGAIAMNTTTIANATEYRTCLSRCSLNPRPTRAEPSRMIP